MPSAAKTWTISDDFDYVLDKFTATSLKVGALDELDEFTSLRAFQLKKGYAIHATIPGYYFINSTDLESSCDIVALPALVTFTDSALPPRIALQLKRAPNEKLYLHTIPTSVKISESAEGVVKWVGKEQMQTVRLDVCAKLETIENRDGDPLAKNLDLWLKDHAHLVYDSHFKLNSLGECRSFCHFSKFESNVATLGVAVEASLRAEIGAATGDSNGGKGSKSTEAANSNSAAYEKELASRLPPIQAVVKQLALQAAGAAVPDGFRLIQLDWTVFGDTFPEVLNEAHIAKLLEDDNCSAALKPKLLCILKQGDILSLLQKHKATVGFTSSPLKFATGTADAGLDDAPPPFQVPDSTDEVVDGEKDGELPSKRQRKQPERLDSTPLAGGAVGKGKANAKPAAPAAGTELKQKRQYNRTGRYSKDPAVAAAAKAQALWAEQDTAMEGLGTPPARPKGDGACLSSNLHIRTFEFACLRNLVMRAMLRVCQLTVLPPPPLI